MTPNPRISFLLLGKHYWFVLLVVLLVIALRVWGDCDRQYFGHSFTPDVQPLYSRVPADDFRFVFNFPASLLSSLLMPPPVLWPPVDKTGFEIREVVSILVELFLTVAFWLGMKQLIKRRPFWHLTRVPIRALLPVFFALWTVYYSYLGGLQAAAFFPHGDKSSYNMARHLFSSFAIDAPAWFGSASLFNLLTTGEANIINPYDAHTSDLASHFLINSPYKHSPLAWEFPPLVMLMWYLIGARLDQWRRGKDTDERYRLSWWNRIIWSLCALYGVWLLYQAMGSFSDWEYELWFSVVAMIWSAVTICGSLYVLGRDGRARRGNSVGIICLLLGLVTFGLAILLKAKLDLDINYLNGLIPNLNANPSHDLWRTLSIAVWGLGLFLEGCYFLWHWRDRPASDHEPTPSA